MFADLGCGACESGLTLDVDDDHMDAAWLLVMRFANAHAAHGYVCQPLDGSSDLRSVK